MHPIDKFERWANSSALGQFAAFTIGVIALITGMWVFVTLAIIVGLALAGIVLAFFQWIGWLLVNSQALLNLLNELVT